MDGMIRHSVKTGTQKVKQTQGQTPQNRGREGVTQPSKMQLKTRSGATNQSPQTLAQLDREEEGNSPGSGLPTLYQVVPRV